MHFSKLVLLTTKQELRSFLFNLLLFSSFVCLFAKQTNKQTWRSKPLFFSRQVTLTGECYENNREKKPYEIVLKFSFDIAVWWNYTETTCSFVHFSREMHARSSEEANRLNLVAFHLLLNSPSHYTRKYISCTSPYTLHCIASRFIPYTLHRTYIEVDCVVSIRIYFFHCLARASTYHIAVHKASSACHCTTWTWVFGENLLLSPSVNVMNAFRAPCLARK